MKSIYVVKAKHSESGEWEKHGFVNIDLAEKKYFELLDDNEYEMPSLEEEWVDEREMWEGI